jgi:glycosyltransferase involved in cell wall biosynthesis
MSAYNPDIELMKISLRSIAAQTWNNVEIFIIDDASEGPHKSAVVELAAAYNNVKVIRVDVNSGPYFGRNLALQQARGQFIAIQDADDWSHPQRLAAQVGYLLQTPEARVVTTEHIRINRAGRVSLEGQFRTFGHGPMTSVFRAEIFDQIGNFAAIRSRGDLEMHERVAAYYGCQANALLPALTSPLAPR